MTATYPFQAFFLAALLSAALTANVAGAGSGADVARDWVMSGSELVGALEGKSSDGAQNSGTGRIESSARGNAYIAGVADATSGKAWCGAGTVLPHELTDRVYTHLRNVTPARLKGSASTLVIEGLAFAFPCRAN